MSRAIVTICNDSYACLLEHWLTALKRVNNLPIFVFCLNGFRPIEEHGFTPIFVNPNNNPFPSDVPDHACAEKLRIFEHLPNEISEILFLDIDVLVFQPFWQFEDLFAISEEKLVMCPDLFVGYKEKMETEFQPYNKAFRMKFNPDGSFFYFNTGVFFASRRYHASWFSRFLDIWSDYVHTIGKYPSIFDQNIINYCIIANNLGVYQISVLNNCLRHYEVQAIGRRYLLLNGQVVNAYHFNGGDGQKKMERWIEILQRLEVKHDLAEP